MTENKKVLIIMPEILIGLTDETAKAEGVSRSELIRRAVKLYIGQKHRMEIREKLRRGYEQMAPINKEWAELGLGTELETYEALLAESEE
ncbi:MAG: ribbon-helix-helix protein, CopG family [Eubacteriales bacterium]|nr:ribbon-helix-helix protein, CopG family [Eubacteriales bacterium]